MAQAETWKDIPGYEGLYQVSDLGNVLSSRFSGQFLKPNRHRDGYLKVYLHKNGARSVRFVHRLVAEAFLGLSDLDVRHNNGNPSDNRLLNIRYGTPSENAMDSVVHGTHAQARKTHCKRGHILAGDNLREYNGRRHCKTCAREWQRNQRAGKRG